MLVDSRSPAWRPIHLRLGGATAATRHKGDVVSTRAFVLTFPYCHFERGGPSSRRRARPRRRISNSLIQMRTLHLKRLQANVFQDQKKAQKVYTRSTCYYHPKSAEDYDASDSTQHAPQVFVSLPPGCVRADCGGAYVRLKKDNGVGHVPATTVQQQGACTSSRGGMRTTCIASRSPSWRGWSDSASFSDLNVHGTMGAVSVPHRSAGRLTSSTAALVAHDWRLRPQDVRAPWSAFDGRRWATVPAAHVRLESRVVGPETLRVHPSRVRRRDPRRHATGAHAGAADGSTARSIGGRARPLSQLVRVAEGRKSGLAGGLGRFY